MPELSVLSIDKFVLFVKERLALTWNSWEIRELKIGSGKCGNQRKVTEMSVKLQDQGMCYKTVKAVFVVVYSQHFTTSQ